jgi:putative transposase
MDQTYEDTLALFQRCISSGAVEYWQEQARMKIRQCVYSSAVVIWLMILQRLQPRGTLATGVEALLAGAADGLLSGCGRARQKRTSHRTGGYSQARQRLPQRLCLQVVRELVLRLREMLLPEGGRPCYLVDGTSIELEASPSLRKAYPPAENQHGRAHWPVLRIVVLHEMETGLAEEPRWGPMYGSEAVSEQELALQAIEDLPPGSTLVWDRNFGVFSLSWGVHQRGHYALARLTRERAYRLAGGPIREEGEWPVRWTPSRFDGRRQGGMPQGAAVEGRLIAVRIGRGKSKEWLYLFTTLTLPREEVVALYGKRYRIETDLRSLKRTVRLHHITARKESMMEKELLTAVAAYNLVRAVMALAARRHQLSPRQLSFTFVLNVVNARWHRLQSASDADAYQCEVFSLLDAAAEGTHPKRKKSRSYPRAVWHRRHTFPARKEAPPDTLI